MQRSPTCHAPILLWSLLVVATLLLATGLSLSTPAPAQAIERLAQCANNLDDDGDARIDFPAEPGCTSALDPTETDPVAVAACADGLDNDGDGKADFPEDSGCTARSDDDEASQGRQSPPCADGRDNDRDGKIDYPADRDCNWAADSEQTTACSDGSDDDGDGKADFPSDLGCANVNDDDESDPPQCDDGRDNDGDGTLDFDTNIPSQAPDPDCASALDSVESPTPARPLPARCADGRDNDGDGKIDYPADRDCSSPSDDDENAPQIIYLLSPGARPRLLTPFPIVHMRGRSDHKGVRITLLTIRAPATSTVTIYCSGKSCSSKRLTIPAKRRIVRVRQLERRLRSGTILKIYVTQPGFIGKYTRFRVTNKGVPQRVDRCATTPDTKPHRCPAS
jgi:hypothetical protein